MHSLSLGEVVLRYGGLQEARSFTWEGSRSNEARQIRRSLRTEHVVSVSMFESEFPYVAFVQIGRMVAVADGIVAWFILSAVCAMVLLQNLN